MRHSILTCNIMCVFIYNRSRAGASNPILWSEQRSSCARIYTVCFRVYASAYARISQAPFVVVRTTRRDEEDEDENKPTDCCALTNLVCCAPVFGQNAHQSGQLSKLAGSACPEPTLSELCDYSVAEVIWQLRWSAITTWWNAEQMHRTSSAV